MQKNWLIRTKSNHILGPVSKEKVLELFKNGSIRAEDEICSGNGYWFFLREQEQVSTYLLGAEKQGFNPISEARDVLTATASTPPGVEHSDITLVAGIDLAGLHAPAEEHQDDTAPLPTPQKKNDSAPVGPPAQLERPGPTPVSPGRSKKGTTVVPKPRVPYAPKKRLVSDKVVMYLGMALLLALAIALYYRNRFLPHLAHALHPLPAALAQDTSQVIKKKVCTSSSQRRTRTSSSWRPTATGTRLRGRSRGRA